jgi:hypothetical protein
MGSRGQTDLSSFLGRCLFLDLEAKEDHIYRIGAVYGQSTFERKGPFDVAHLKKGDAVKFLSCFSGLPSGSRPETEEP